MWVGIDKREWTIHPVTHGMLRRFKQCFIGELATYLDQTKTKRLNIRVDGMNVELSVNIETQFEAVLWCSNETMHDKYGSGAFNNWKGTYLVGNFHQHSHWHTNNHTHCHVDGTLHRSYKAVAHNSFWQLKITEKDIILKIAQSQHSPGASLCPVHGLQESDSRWQY